jgi:hypothetical protein
MYRFRYTLTNEIYLSRNELSPVPSGVGMPHWTDSTEKYVASHRGWGWGRVGWGSYSSLATFVIILVQAWISSSASTHFELLCMV